MPRLRTHYSKLLAPRMSTWLALDAARTFQLSSHFLTAFQKGNTQNTMKGVCLPLCQPTEQASKIVAFKCLHSCCMDALLGPPQLHPAAGKWCIDCGSVQPRSATRGDYTYRHITRPPTHLTVCAVNLETMNPLRS